MIASCPPSRSRTNARLSRARRGGPFRGRAWWTTGLLPLFLPGCPLFPENGCFVDADCATGYACEARTGECVAAPRAPRVCGAPGDCEENETCARSGVCTAGDCTFSGCVDGYVCGQQDGYWSCVPASAGEGGQAGEGGAASSQGGDSLGGNTSD